MYIKVENVPFRLVDPEDDSHAQAATRVAKQFNLLIELVIAESTSNGPEVHLIGSPAAILKAFTTTDGGWGSGDPVVDAEMLYHVFNSATLIFG